jgi:hypothetical protein
MDTTTVHFMELAVPVALLVPPVHAVFAMPFVQYPSLNQEASKKTCEHLKTKFVMTQETLQHLKIN